MGHLHIITQGALAVHRYIITVLASEFWDQIKGSEWFGLAYGVFAIISSLLRKQSGIAPCAWMQRWDMQISF